MDRPRTSGQVRLTVVENEPLAHLTRLRLREERIPCVVRSLGAGPGGWGVATNQPHAIYVNSVDEMRAREVLDLPPAEITEREGTPSQPMRRLPMPVIVLLIITAAALLIGTLEIVINRIIR